MPRPGRPAPHQNDPPGDDQQPTPYAEVTFRRQLHYPRIPSSHQSLGPVRARITVLCVTRRSQDATLPL